MVVPEVISPDLIVPDIVPPGGATSGASWDNLGEHAFDYLTVEPPGKSNKNDNMDKGNDAVFIGRLFLT